jgi:hypothetical protein
LPSIRLPAYSKSIMDTSRFATKQDVEEIVGRVVGQIVGDALQLISERFDRLEGRMERMEDKLDRTAAIVDLHAVDIRALQRKAV